MNKWSFPNNGFGQISGILNAGLEHFKGEEIKSLAREICQNSLDAQENYDKPVRVEFSFGSLPSNEVEGLDEYRKVLGKCYDYWNGQKNKKAIDFLDKAIKESRRDQISFLRISDYNTKGLLWAYSDKADGWNALTKIEGGATKNGDEAGSFGIGKNAPFLNSYFRVVYYRTLNIDGERATQGVARIMSFPENIKDEMGSMTTGVGFFGNPDRNKPVEKLDFLDKLACRNEVGTDVFVCGFCARNNWKTDLCKAIVQNFAVSVSEGRLEVIVDDEKINSNTLERYINRFDTKDNVSVFSVLSMKDEVKEYTKDLLGGMFRLRLLINEENDKSLNQKILVVRSVGMKLFNLPAFSNSITYTGILDIKGKKLSEFFREMENPAHDTWKPNRHPDKELAKKYYDDLKEWISSIITEIGDKYIGEEVAVKGLGNILAQKQSQKIKNGGNHNKEETLSNELSKIDLVIVKKKMAAKGLVITKGSKHQNDEKPKRTPGVISKDGTDDAIRTLGGRRERVRKEEHKGIPQNDGKDIVNETQKIKAVPKSFDKLRIIKIKKSVYKIVLENSNSINKGHLELLTVGENGGVGTLFIKDVRNCKGFETTSVKDGIVMFTGMKGKEKVSLEIELVGSNDYAMEVKIHEHS